MINKKVIILLGIVLLIVGIVYAAGVLLYGSTSDKGNISSSSINSGLVGHWALDSESYNSATNRTTDKTPYENHGTNYGATLITDRMGRSDNAMYFDGFDDYIEILDSDSLSFTDGIGNDKPFSISFWFKPGSTSAQWFINKRGATQATQTEWQMSIYSSKLGFSCFNGGSNTASIGANMSNPLGTGEWKYVVVTYNGNESEYGLDIYVNSILQNAEKRSTGTYTGMSNTLANVTIGKAGWGSSFYLNGALNDVRIYNRALSEDEIKNLYNSYNPKLSSGSLQKGLIFDMLLTSTWTKGGAAGSEIMTDRTPYSNDGQNYGASVGSEYTTFDGVNDYINCGNNILFNSSKPTTVSFWTYLNRYSSDYPVVLILKTNQATGFIFFYNLNGAGYRGINFGSNLNFVRLRTEQNVSESLKGIWNNVVMVYDGVSRTTNSSYKLYLNSVEQSLVNSSSFAVVPLTNNISSVTSSQRFNGSISNVKIYNRALSAEEIKLLYDKGRW